MKKLDAVLLKMFLCGLPMIAVLGLFSYFYNRGAVFHDNGYARWLNDLGGFAIAIWLLFSIYLGVRLMVSEQFRECVMARLTFMRERDEREVMLTGRATRTTFLTSLAILILLFCLSCLQVSFYRVPPEKAVNGKTGVVTLGLGFSLLDQPKASEPEAPMQKTDLFSYSGLPVSSATVILFLILWHIFCYNYSMRRLRR